MEEKKQNPIANALGISSDHSIVRHTENVPTTIDMRRSDQTELDADFDKVRASTYDLQEDVSVAIKELLDIAIRSQDHEAYSSLASLIKTAAILNRDLVGMHEKRRAPDPNKQQPGVTHNVLVLTTAELQEKLNKDKNG